MAGDPLLSLPTSLSSTNSSALPWLRPPRFPLRGWVQSPYIHSPQAFMHTNCAPFCSHCSCAFPARGCAPPCTPCPPIALLLPYHATHFHPLRTALCAASPVDHLHLAPSSPALLWFCNLCFTLLHFPAMAAAADFQFSPAILVGPCTSPVISPRHASVHLPR